MDSWAPALVLCCCVFITGLDRVKAEGFSFGYDGESGPDHWAEYYETCGGQYQSPINIEEHKVQQVQLAPLRFLGFDALPTTTILSNNGHTAMLQMNTSEEVLVRGGPLKGEYVFAQLHFHWGESDSTGSEDTINNRSYPMEMHMVTYKKAYHDSGEAGKHQDGMAVLAFFFEVFPDDNVAYADIVNTLPQVREPDSHARLTQGSSLNMLASDNREHYYTYHGSLTTPPCSEVVTWIEFVEPVLISEDQLEAFRGLQGHEGSMSHNYRPTQPIGGRIIWYNEANVDTDRTLDGDSVKRSSGWILQAPSFAILLILTQAYACVNKAKHF